MIGIDIVEIKRISKALKNEKFLKRVFTLQEIEYAKMFRDSICHLAGFYCAKEAVMKALADCKQLSFLDIEIWHKENNQPYVKLYNRAQAVFVSTKFDNLAISISQTKNYATAICVLIKN